MKIAKEFRWEMGHRLPFHEDKCKNIHGHSYKMLVEFTGTEDENGMVLDYYIVKEIISPLVDELDHSFMVYEKDTEMIEFLVKMDMKHLITPFQSTAENMVHYFLEKISKAKLPDNISAVMVKLFETESTYAEDSLIIK